MTRQEAIAMIEDDKKRHHDELSGRYRAALTMAIEALQTDIVRCKDCKWYENACTFFAADPFERAPMEKNDFCSYGERRIENITVKLSKDQPKQDSN